MLLDWLAKGRLAGAPIEIFKTALKDWPAYMVGVEVRAGQEMNQ